MDLKLEPDKLLVPDFRPLQRKFNILLANQGALIPPVQACLESYCQRFRDINEIVIKDLKGGTKISITNHELSDSTLGSLSSYLRDMDMMNINSFSIKLQKDIQVSSDPTINSKLSSNFFNWHTSFTRKWEDKLEAKILEIISSSHKQKCALSFGIFNFSDYDISPEDLNILKTGKNMVFEVAQCKDTVRNRILKESMLFATKYRQYIERNKTQLPDNISFQSWLNLASQSSTTQDSHLFYKHLKSNLSSSLSNLNLPAINNSSLTENSLISRFDYPHFIWQECDKEMGFALLPIESVISAEEKTIADFKGTLFPHSSPELLDKIREDFDNLRRSFDGNQNFFVNTYTPNIEPSSYDSVEVPFLNLKPKIHKLSDDDIAAKNLKKLTLAL